MYGIHYQQSVYMLVVLICSRTESLRLVTLRIRAGTLRIVEEEETLFVNGIVTVGAQ